MSILQIVETSPGRVRGLVRYLVGISSQRQKESLLKAIMSPDTLPVPWPLTSEDEEPETEVEPEPVLDRRAGGPQMIDKVINGCERIGLIVRDGDEIVLNPELPADARLERKADARLPLSIAELVFDPNRPENLNLAHLIAWYLLQDPLNAPRNEHSVIAALRTNAVLHDYFGLMNQSYGQFEDWVVFLGFAWGGVSHERKRAISPDPTPFLRRILPGIFAEAKASTVAAAEIVRLVAERCPVLEGGQHREYLLQLGSMREEPGYLSPVTSQAWLRLADEGYWELMQRSDAGSPVVLVDGTESRQVAAVRLKQPRQSTRRAAV